MTHAQFRSNDLSCISCSSSTTYISTQAECDKCGYRHWTQDPNGTTDSDGNILGNCAR